MLCWHGARRDPAKRPRSGEATLTLSRILGNIEPRNAPGRNTRGGTRYDCVMKRSRIIRDLYPAPCPSYDYAQMSPGTLLPCPPLPLRPEIVTLLPRPLPHLRLRTNFHKTL